MPLKYLGLFGLETWRARRRLLGVHAEYADTTCDFLSDPPESGCAYTNGISTSGYRYRGRALGHSMDADGESVGGVALLIDSRAVAGAAGRNVKLIRAGVALDHPGRRPRHRARPDPRPRSGHPWVDRRLSVYATWMDRPVAVEDGVRGS